MTVGHLLFAAVMTVYMVVAVQFEERDLVAHFGKQYSDYQRRVPMFIPSLKPQAVSKEESDKSIALEG
jgi:protein-S-isoprenylcysteine O-methyltransferase Ste14